MFDFFLLICYLVSRKCRLFQPKIGYFKSTFSRLLHFVDCFEVVWHGQLSAVLVHEFASLAGSLLSHSLKSTLFGMLLIFARIVIPTESHTSILIFDRIALFGSLEGQGWFAKTFSTLLSRPKLLIHRNRIPLTLTHSRAQLPRRKFYFSVSIGDLLFLLIVLKISLLFLRHLGHMWQRLFFENLLPINL